MTSSQVHEPLWPHAFGRPAFGSLTPKGFAVPPHAQPLPMRKGSPGHSARTERGRKEAFSADL